MSASGMKLTQEAAYRDWLASVKSRIHAARMNIALSANSELIALYYELGARITERESTAQWGSDFIDAFSKDLRSSFPDLGGFSAKNLRCCRAFFRFYCCPAIWQQAVAKLASDPWAGVEAELARQLVQISWGHHTPLPTGYGQQQRRRLPGREDQQDGRRAGGVRTRGTLPPSH